MMVVSACIIFMVTVVNLPIAHLLRITNFYVPRRAYNQVEIDCKYDLEGGQLHSVKWYKDNEEFLRCTAQGEVIVFPVVGVMTRHPRYSVEGSCPLTLIALSPKSAGDYMCEVSLDAPDFITEYKHSRLDLLLPDRTQEHSKEAKGTEKHTSVDKDYTAEDDTPIQSLGSQRSKSLFVLLFTIFVIFT